MKRPSVQIRLRGILLATFWMAVCFGAFAAINTAHRERTSLTAEIPLTWLMMIAPFVAAGALFGRTIVGAVIGVLAVCSFWFVWNLT